MSDNNNGRSPIQTFFDDLGQELKQIQQTAADEWHALTVALRNQTRQARDAYVDYIFLPIGGPLPERAYPPRTFIERQLPLPPPPLSMQTLNRRLRDIGDAANVKGVVFVFRGFGCGLATLQNVRRAMKRLKEAGKETIVFTPYLDLRHYYTAVAADKVIIPPGAPFEVLGLRSEVVFLKDALNRIGVQAEAIQISPYKTGPNMFSQSGLTPEHEEQINWLLDDWYDLITAEIAADRGLTQAEVQAHINQSPLFAEQALATGLVDDLAYEDELAELLAAPPEKKDEAEAKPEADEEIERKKPKAKLLVWSKARPLLMEKSRRRSTQIIGVISLEGVIMMGTSRQSPIDVPLPIGDEQTAGEQTLVGLLRRAERNKDLAALVFHVDSGGGSGLASALIAREIKRIAEKKPVVVYMGNSAASGGYFVSAPAQHIMSQTATVTGSIGVWSLHVATDGLYQLLSVNRASLQRGDRAGLYSDDAPLTPENREVLWQSIVDHYQKFKQVVADGRHLPFDELDPICEGRVWNGRQALERQLVDSHGDFMDAVKKAAD
ncbi:MAG: signal peptide peptidase SppA, partial [Anaerolineae bacterium]